MIQKILSMNIFDLESLITNTPKLLICKTASLKFKHHELYFNEVVMSEDGKINHLLLLECIKCIYDSATRHLLYARFLCFFNGGLCYFSITLKDMPYYLIYETNSII